MKPMKLETVIISVIIDINGYVRIRSKEHN